MSGAGEAPVDRLIDWGLTASSAAIFSGRPPSAEESGAQEVVASLKAAARAAVSPVAEVTGLIAPAPPAQALVLDRPAWASFNAASLRGLLAPVLAGHYGGHRHLPPQSVLRIGSRAAGLQLGAVLGLMSSRVLGQYEPVALAGGPLAGGPLPGGHQAGEPDKVAGKRDSGPGRLVLVAPNIIAAERDLGVDPIAFRAWVCVHEETHRVQFETHPWLGVHLRASVRGIFSELLEGQGLGERLGEVVTAVAEAVSGRSGPITPLNLLQSGAVREQVIALTSTMALLEGHAEVVMDSVSPEVVPGVAHLRERFARRRIPRNAADRALRTVLGLDEKARQYTEGARFVRRIVGAVSMAGFNAVWTGPETLPSGPEIADPDLWLARVAPTTGG